MMQRLTLTLVVSLGLFALAAQAAPPLFPGAGGDYGGLLEADAGGDPDNSGILTVTLRDTGAATLKLAWQGQVYAFKAPFASDGQLTHSFKKKGDAGTQLQLVCALNADTRMIMGTLTDPTADAGSPLSTSFTLSGQVADPALAAQLSPGLRMAFIDPPVMRPAAEGKSTRGSVGPTEISEDGFSLVTIGKTAKRSSRFVGNLPDATKYSAGSPLRGGQYALRAALYAQKKAGSGGQLLGRGDVASTGFGAPAGRESNGIGGSAASLIAGLRWHKKNGSQIKTSAYPGGLDQQVDLDTITYTPDRDLGFVLTGQRELHPNATLRLSDGNLGTRVGTPGPNPITVSVNVTAFGAKILGENPYKVKLSVNPRAAKFSGSFKHPDTGETMKFSGAFRSFVGLVPGQGRGNFLSRGPAPRTDAAAAESGSVRIIVN